MQCGSRKAMLSQPASSPVVDPFAAKRAAMREEFFAKLFLLGGWLGGTDTYKRTMWTAVPDIAVARAGYALTMRKGLPEPGANNQLIMAGHEAMLAQWFHRPLRRADIELAACWFTEQAFTRAFPRELWQTVLAAQLGDDIFLPLDIWGFPGGQTFLAGMPCLSFEGLGGAISYLEAAMCRYFAPIIQATKARLMKLATPRDAEFGLRSAPNELTNLVLLLARYVGGRGQLTSNDTAEFLYPELFRSVGTIGHEMMCAAQSFDRPLGDAEYEMMDRFISALGQASLLGDLVDAATADRPNVKFSNSPGKESLGGYLRVYARSDTLVVADASEPPQGEPLFVPLVQQGRLVYRESFEEQAERTDRTWGRYQRWELSPK